MSNPVQCMAFFMCVSTVVVFHKTLGRGLCLINQNAKKKEESMRQEERCSLDKNTSIEKQGQRLDTRVHCSWTCLGKSEERGHDRDRRRKTEKQKDSKKW